MTLAERFNGEIINADALQMYVGLPITTNKISREERKGIPHHLLGCIGLEEEPWTVGTFVKRAAGIIDEVRARGKVPIVVGGTHYYTQSLLFKESILEAEQGGSKGEKDLGYMTTEEQEQKWPILAGTGVEMLTELQRVDPEMARKWHPSDTRKIRRSLEIWLRTGKKASEIYREQQSHKLDHAQHNGTANGSSLTLTTPKDILQPHPTLRHHTLILWTHAEPSILKARLNARVNTMLASGLLPEVQSMRTVSSQLQTQTLPGKDTDLNKGIWVAIGYKEFAAYFSALEQGDADAKRLAALKDEAIDKTQAATRQYAKRQVRWIRLKLLRELAGVGVGEDTAIRNFYVLDGTDVAQFTEKVEETASVIAESFLAGKEMPDPMRTSKVAERVLRQGLEDLKGGRKSLDDDDDGQRTERECAVCDALLVTPNDWKQHLRSKGHRYRVKRMRRELEEEKGRSA